MPRGDGTGPSGQGPKTGKGLGKCGSKINGSTKTILKDITKGAKEQDNQAINRTVRGQGFVQNSGRGCRK